MFKEKIIKNIFLVFTLFLLYHSSVIAHYEQVEFAKNVSAFDIWGKDEVLLGDASGKLTLFNMRTGQELFFFNQNEEIISLAKIPGQSRALVSFASGMVALFRCDGKILRREYIVISSFRKHFPVKTIQISPDGKFALFHGDRLDRKGVLPEVWNLEQNRMTFKFSKMFNAEESVITPDSNCIIVHGDPGILLWYRLCDGRLFNWVNVNYTFGLPSEKDFVEYRDIINISLQHNEPVLVMTTSSGNILKVDLSSDLKLIHQSAMNLSKMYTLDSMMMFQTKNRSEFFIGSHSLFFENKLFLFDCKKHKVITCSTSKSIKTIKILNGRLPITLLDDGTLVGWIFSCLSHEKFIFDRNLEQEFAKLDLI